MMNEIFSKNQRSEAAMTLSRVAAEIRNTLTKPGYPCVAAIQSYQKSDYQVGVYRSFGRGTDSALLCRDLLEFRDQQKSSQSPYSSFWAVYPDDEVTSEEDFENKLWAELSQAAAWDSSPWDKNFSADPADKNFTFSLGGDAFFLVGMHAKSSRLGRQFTFPAIIFNLYEQFEQLDRAGHYQPMVQANRKRDIKFQGDLNPMVEKYGDRWEAIQFSGKNNPDSWKCPFKHLSSHT